MNYFRIVHRGLDQDLPLSNIKSKFCIYLWILISSNPKYWFWYDILKYSKRIQIQYKDFCLMESELLYSIYIYIYILIYWELAPRGGGGAVVSQPSSFHLNFSSEIKKKMFGGNIFFPGAIYLRRMDVLSSKIFINLSWTYKKLYFNE